MGTSDVAVPAVLTRARDPSFDRKSTNTMVPERNVRSRPSFAVSWHLAPGKFFFM